MEILIRMLRLARFRIPVGLAIFAASCAALHARTVEAMDAPSLEYSVKAAYLYKFGIYVEWPSTAFASPNSALTLCVLGEDPFGAALDNAVNGQNINGHPVVVHRLKAFNPDSNCHILYVGLSETAQANQAAEAVRGRNVLTISDSHTPGASAGIINFVIKDNRVRFNIDDEAAAQNGLAISSKLLGLALNVKPRSPREVR